MVRLQAVVITLAAYVAVALVSSAHAADCIGDGQSCVTGEQVCPVVCCTGVPIRISGPASHCPEAGAIFTDVQPPSSITTDSDTDEDTEGATATGAATAVTQAPSDSVDPPASTPEPETPTPSTQTSSSSSSSASAPSSVSTPSSTNVDALDASTSITGRGNGNSTTTVGVIVAALGCCGALMGAVVYKRRQQTHMSPTSGTTPDQWGTGLTPDNRSLTGRMETGALMASSTATTTNTVAHVDVPDSGAHRGTRSSSPFGHSVRISSPRMRGDTNEDIVFAADGSSVRVNAQDKAVEI